MWDDAGTAQEITDGAADSPEAAPSPIAVPPTPGAVLLIDAQYHHCRWPLWDGETQAKYVCGAPRHGAATSYCCEHWLASGGASVRRAPSARSLIREPKAIVRQRLDLLTVQRNEGF